MQTSEQIHGAQSDALPFACTPTRVTKSFTFRRSERVKSRRSERRANSRHSERCTSQLESFLVSKLLLDCSFNGTRSSTLHEEISSGNSRKSRNIHSHGRKSHRRISTRKCLDLRICKVNNSHLQVSTQNSPQGG